MPSSVSDGVRRRAERMRRYSSALMLCCPSSCGVTATGEGTTPEEAEFITVASFVARCSHCDDTDRVWKARTFGRLTPRVGRAWRKDQAMAARADWIEP